MISRVWNAAQQTGRILITQDLDFSDIRRFSPGNHHGLVLVRLRAPGRLALSRRVREVFSSEPVQSWESCFVVITDIKVRVRGPKR
jgi:predicted nuclease of predicted toxin-antitoxin system